MSIKYDPEFKQTEIGYELYRRWVRIRKNGCCAEWEEDFNAFAEWSLSSGYELGSSLKRFDSSQEASPTNCFWSTGKGMKVYYTDSEFCARWNRTVNLFRKRYGMMPFVTVEEDNSAKTCKDCVHYKVCKYKISDMTVCEDFLD